MRASTELASREGLRKDQKENFKCWIAHRHVNTKIELQNTYVKEDEKCHMGRTVPEKEITCRTKWQSIARLWQSIARLEHQAEEGSHGAQEQAGSDRHGRGRVKDSSRRGGGLGAGVGSRAHSGGDHGGRGSSRGGDLASVTSRDTAGAGGDQTNSGG